MTCRQLSSSTEDSVLAVVSVRRSYLSVKKGKSNVRLQEASLASEDTKDITVTMDTMVITDTTEDTMEATMEDITVSTLKGVFAFARDL